MIVRRADVARLAGVSPAVVSYVLNDGPRPVAPETRARVVAAVDQLGYRPNGVARSLRTSRTMTIGLVLPDAAHPFFAHLARSIEDAAFARGYLLLLGNAHEDPVREGAYVRTFLDRAVDALLIVPAHATSDWLPDVGRAGRPCAVLDRRLANPSGLDQVVADNVAGGEVATMHLLEHGRRRIACITGPTDVESANERALGWRQALTNAGLNPTSLPLRHQPFTRQGGYDAAQSILDGDDVDAIFVASDQQAFGVLRAIADHGRRCPDDVAVVSFDGITASTLTTPTLTTMALSFEDFAEVAVARVIGRLDDPSTCATTYVLPVTLVARESCGCTP